MNELELKYGCNPNQKPAKVFVTGGELPFEVLNGRPGYINLLDALKNLGVQAEPSTVAPEGIICRNHSALDDSEHSAQVYAKCRTKVQ